MARATKKKLSPRLKHKAKHPTPAGKKDFFTRAANAAAQWTGSTQAFSIAALSVILWACTGPYFHFSDTWQIVINTATTIVTFLLVFLIQHSQNRDTCALHLKLDELLRCTKGAHTALIELEALSEDELKEIYARYKALAEEARRRMREGKADTGVLPIAVEEK
ncbi:MAG TPA: low affinity iron permease family protein [Alphaproteobacteria bacterium]|nr:low affinity iron permease family protein [Alphaproteobacteria bacterium]